MEREREAGGEETEQERKLILKVLENSHSNELNSAEGAYSPLTRISHQIAISLCTADFPLEEHALFLHSCARSSLCGFQGCALPPSCQPSPVRNKAEHASHNISTSLHSAYSTSNFSSWSSAKSGSLSRSSSCTWGGSGGSSLTSYRTAPKMS